MADVFQEKPIRAFIYAGLSRVDEVGSSYAVEANVSPSKTGLTVVGADSTGDANTHIPQWTDYHAGSTIKECVVSAGLADDGCGAL